MAGEAMAGETPTHETPTHETPTPEVLAHETYGGNSRPILALHGISSTRKLWLWLHEVAPDLRLIAPDLRGRGDSLNHGRPEPSTDPGQADHRANAYGIDEHVSDLIALLNHIGLRRVHVVGMSLGGFVAVRLARTHPGRVATITLIDGGLPMTLPPGLTAQVLPQVFGARLARLGRPWDSLEAYRDYFCGEVAPLLAPDDPLLLQYLAHDLDARGLLRLDGNALLADAEDVYFAPNPWRDLDTQVHLLHAQWSLGTDSVPAYEPNDLTAIAATGVPTTLIPGVDHASSIMTRHGASRVADRLRQALADPTG